MSKTRGTFILARTYLDHLPPDYLRYYLAARLGGGQDDLDLNLDDFVTRCNADLVKKAANLCSRSVKFIVGRLGGTLAALPADAAPLVEKAKARLAAAPDLYRGFESTRAVRLAMEVAEDFNLYLTEKEPWKLAKTDPDTARAICSAGVYASQVVAAILAPVLPAWATKVATMLRRDSLRFGDAGEPLPAGHAIGEYITLAEPIDAKKIDAIIEASRSSLGPAEPDTAPAHDYEVPALTDEASIDQFSPVDLRVGKVVACAPIEGAKKLLQLTVDLGPLGQRNIFSGIARSYAPEQLVGKVVAVFANLAPRKMRFGTSEGMILAAGADDDAITILELDSRARPGDRIT
jgi:methionyl-tRNA synthetase